MKSKIVSLLAVFFVIICSLNIAAQEFPIGLYSGARNTTPLDSFMTPIHNIGANMIVCPVNMATAPTENTSGQFRYILPSNAYSPNDKVFYFSGGYWSSWSPKIPAAGIGGDEAKILEKTFGAFSDDGAANTDTTYVTSTEFFITGPGYKQDYIYSRNKRGYDVNVNTFPVPNLIDYQAVFSMKLGRPLSSNAGTGDYSKICEISAWIDNAQILKRDVFIRDFDTLSSGYTEILLLNSADSVKVYNYAAYAASPENVTNSIGPFSTPNPSAVTEEYKTIQFKVKWFGHRQLFVKQVDVFDYTIGRRLKDDFPNVKIDIEDYLNKDSNQFHNYTNIANWYSLDEPATIDSYRPYAIVDTIARGLTANSNVNINVRKSLITAFSPFYKEEVQYQGNRTFPRWLREARPEILLFDFYPVNRRVYCNGSISIPMVYQQFNVLRGLLASASKLQDSLNIAEKVYYAGQGHSYTNPDTALNVFQPDTCKFKIPAMLALAYGVKGLLFYNYRTDGSNLGLDSSYALRRAFSYLAARLKGTLGNKLMSLKYQNQFLKVNYNTYSDESAKITDSTAFSPAAITIADDGVTRNFHAGILYDPAEANSKYLFLVNMIPVTGSASAALNFCFNGFTSLYGSTSPYKNISLADVESTDIYSLSSNNGSSSITMNNAEGKLFRIAPVVKNGGIIRVSETLSDLTTLSGALTIASGATLTINNTYNIYSSITIKQGGCLILNSAGRLNFYNGTSLNVKGRLELRQGIVDFQSITIGNGIIVDSGKIVALSSEIKNAQYGVYISTRSDTIYNCNIHNCGYGVYTVNVIDFPYYTHLLYNNIHDNIHGVSFTNAVSFLAYNQIYNNVTGVSCFNSSSPTFYTNTTAGFNCIYNNEMEGLVCYNYSSPNLGTYGQRQGFNKIAFNTDVNLYASNYCTITTQENFWEYPVNTGKI